MPLNLSNEDCILPKPTNPNGLNIIFCLKWKEGHYNLQVMNQEENYGFLNWWNKLKAIIVSNVFSQEIHEELTKKIW